MALSANVEQRVDTGSLGQVLLPPGNPGGLGVGEGNGHQGFTINLLEAADSASRWNARSWMSASAIMSEPAASLEEAYGVSPEELFEVYPEPLSGAILGGSYRRRSGCFLAVVDCVAVSHIR
jgi:hypothetical protein